MTKVLRFGSYSFPDTGVEFGDNFRDMVARTSRLPGMDGGYDEYGTSRAAAEIGDVRFSMILKADTAEAMQMAREALAQIVHLGKQRLWVETYDGAQRFTWARVNSIQISERYKEFPALNQRVTINWQVSDPRWFQLGTEAWSWGDGTAWGAAAWGGEAAATACSGTQTDFTVSTAGNAETEARITIACGAAQTCENPTVQRLVGGVVVDEVSWTGILGNNETLEINARSLSVKKNGTDAYGTAFAFEHPAWFRILPGTNSIRVIFDNAGDAADVKVRFYNAYR